MNEHINHVTAHIGHLLSECARAQRLLVNPLPATERSHLLVNVCDAVSDLEDALFALREQIKKELA